MLALVSAAFVHGSAQAQATDAGEDLPRKIRDDLTSRGFTDVKVVPQSFLISAKDKNGEAIVMLVGPNSMTVLAAPPSGDEQAESKDGEHKLIQQ